MSDPIGLERRGARRECRRAGGIRFNIVVLTASRKPPERVKVTLNCELWIMTAVAASHSWKESRYQARWNTRARTGDSVFANSCGGAITSARILHSMKMDLSVCAPPRLCFEHFALARMARAARYAHTPCTRFVCACTARSRFRALYTYATAYSRQSYARSSAVALYRAFANPRCDGRGTRGKAGGGGGRARHCTRELIVRTNRRDTADAFLRAREEKSRSPRNALLRSVIFSSSRNARARWTSDGVRGLAASGAAPKWEK